MRAIESTVVFSAGALCYWALELAWRGWTHWTMPLTGGFCFLLMYAIANFMDEALWKKWVMSAACLTAVEFVVGILVNIRLGWHVWDYSGQRFHLYGQICPRFFRPLRASVVSTNCA